MIPRKNPVLIRRGGLSGDYFALTSYRVLPHPNGVEGETIIHVTGDGKHDVTADVERLIADRCTPLVEAASRVASWLGANFTADMAQDFNEDLCDLRDALRAHRGEGP